ncbi:MAG: RagB/SusD family nutrient uptake outer membrane protein [Bacteroidetes bacterium]|nr:RagB/SusD family nutrient uptake outer membrane protein [Bacteroidota bacterium]
MKIMNKNKFVYAVLSVILVLGPVACKDQLDVGNPNAPTVSANVNSETGIIQYAQGVTYINGFKNGNDWLGNSYFSLPWGYSELMADNVGASASNNQVTTMGQPDYIILDNGQKVSNNSPQVGIIRSYNNRPATGAGNNALYYQWLTMYALNNAQNSILSVVDKIKFTGDAASKANTVKAWAYWWKGYAYAAIGSMYVAGLIADDFDAASNVTKISHDYVSSATVIARSDYYYDQAAAALAAVTSASDYSEILGQLIPSYMQTGKGGVLSITEWNHSINTMKARNILVNHLAPFVNGNPNATITGSSMTPMTAADWTNVFNLTTNGVQASDKIFTVRSSATNSVFSPTSGTVASMTANTPSSSTFKISERFLQYYRTGDARKANNFTPSAGYIGDYTYTTGYTLVTGGNGAPGVQVLANKAIGAYEVIIAASYEENALMLAEANIRGAGTIAAGTALIDAVRSYLGAGLAAITPTTQVAALQELVSERRVALVFRGLSFYDSRRWGWTYDISKGGGSYGNYVKYSGTVNTNVTISYNFMDYWDVPADEFVLNAPSASSVPIQNPNF